MACAGRGPVLAILTGLAFAASARGDYQSTMDALTRGLPPDASALVHRIVDCNHWGGEEPYDDARRAEIDKAMNQLDCNGLSRDEASLRRRYAADRVVLDAFDKAHRLAE
jgi:hypothetical protein